MIIARNQLFRVDTRYSRAYSQVNHYLDIGDVRSENWAATMTLKLDHEEALPNAGIRSLLLVPNFRWNEVSRLEGNAMPPFFISSIP